MKQLILACLLALSTVAQVSAASVTLTREYTYQAGDADSKLSSRSIALEQVKRLLLEELGTYLISNTVVKDSQLSKDEIITYTAGAVVTVILEEKWDGSTYYLKVKLTADPDDVARSLSAIKNDNERSAELAELRNQANESLKEIERLNKALANLKQVSPVKGSDQAAELLKQYEVNAGQLAAKEFLEQGIMLRNEKKYDRAVDAFTRAIKLAPGWDQPYVGRGAVYGSLNDYSKSAIDLEHATKLNPQNMLALSFHGVSLMQQGMQSNGITEIKQAVDTEPGNVFTNINMGWALLQMNQPRKSLFFLTKAIKLSHQKNGRAYLLRAKAFRELGEREKAKADIAIAREIGEVSPPQKWNSKPEN